MNDVIACPREYLMGSPFQLKKMADNMSLRGQLVGPFPAPVLAPLRNSCLMDTYKPNSVPAGTRLSLRAQRGRRPCPFI